MPRILKLLSLILSLGLVSSFAYSGEYHAPKERTQSGTETISCGQCHTMHGTEAGQSMIFSGGPTLYTKLLRAATSLDLCRYCHDSALPVPINLGGLTPPKVVNNDQIYTPSAGDFAYRNVVNEANRHSICNSCTVPTPPGYTGITWTGANSVTEKFGTTSFNCLYCHDPHGNNNYRNLRYDPGNPGNDSWASTNRVVVSYSNDTQANCSGGVLTPCDVNETTSANNLTKYYRANVTFRRVPLDADNPVRGISAWCGRCHGLFYGKSFDSNMGGATGGDPGAGDSTNPWVRHPVQDINIGATNLHADSNYWSAASWPGGNASRTRHIDPDVPLLIDGDEQPMCLSCHYAHGGGNRTATGDTTVNHSMLVMIDGAGTLNIEPSGTDTFVPPDSTSSTAARMRNTCQQCHNQ